MASTSNSSRASNTGSLLLRVGQRDPEAWQRMTELYGPLVYHWCRQCHLSAEDSGDIVQEVFMSVARAIGGFLDREEGSFRGWLWMITRNQVRDHCRRQSRRIEEAAGGTVAHCQLQELPEPPLDDAPEPTSIDARHQLFRRAMKLVRSEFTDRTWQAFWRSTVQEHDTSDIAADLEITANAVRQYKSRVLRRLRQELGD